MNRKTERLNTVVPRQVSKCSLGFALDYSVGDFEKDIIWLANGQVADQNVAQLADFKFRDQVGRGESGMGEVQCLLRARVVHMEQIFRARGPG